MHTFSKASLTGFEKYVTQATISRRSLIEGTTLSRYINGSREVPAIIVFRIALSMRLNLMEAIEQGIYDILKVEAVLKKFTNGEESLFTKKEHEEFSLTDEDMEIEII